MESTTIVIATYNSSIHLPHLRESLRKQRDESGARLLDQAEVLCVDGGSTDNSLELIEEYGWQAVVNSNGDPASAKRIGWERARNDLIFFLDHDERLLCPDSFARKLDVLSQDPRVIAVFSSGYSLDGLSNADSYLSEFGDAFSCFFYRTRNTSRNGARSRGLNVETELQRATIFATPSARSRVLLEITAQGTLTSKSRLHAALGKSGGDGESMIEGIGLTGLDPVWRVGILEDDPVQHLPNATWSTIRRKTRWRLHNNLQNTQASAASLAAREKKAVVTLSLMLFVLHTALLLPLILRAFRISLASRKNYFCGHIYLTVCVLLDSFPVLIGRNQHRYGS